MTLPLALLSIGAVAGGLLGLTAANGTLTRFLTPVVGAPAEPTSGLSDLALSVISVVIALAGVGVAYLFFASGRIDWLARRQRNEDLHTFLEKGWHIDAAYAEAVEGPGKASARFLAFVIDKQVIDGAVNKP